MYSEYTQYYHDVACSGSWARENSDTCGCKGKGWWLSELDTWHQCPYHGKDVPHPEEYDYEQELKLEVESHAKEQGMTIEEYLNSLAPIVIETDNDDDIPF